MLIYNSVLSQAQIQAVLANLNAQWGTTGGPAGGTGPLPAGSDVSITSGNLDVNGLTQTIGSLNTSSGTNVYLGGGTLTLSDNNVSVVGGVIADTGGNTNATGGSIVKQGSGTLTLNNANTYSGQTLVSAGTVQLGNALALQNSTANVTVNNGLTFSSGIDAPTIGGLTGSGNIALQDLAGSPNPVNLSLGNNNASTTYSGALSGPGGITKIGTGTLTLAGISTYTGPTTVSAGTLQIGLQAPNNPAVPVAHYALDGNVNDSGVNGLNGTLNGTGTSYVLGRFGQAISFPANNNSAYVSVPYNSTLGLHTFTVSAWLDLAAQPGSAAGLVGTRFGPDNTFDMKYQPGGGGYQLHGDIGTGGGWLTTAADYTLPSPLSLNTWHLVTYEATTNSYAIFLDGAQVATGSYSGAPLFMQSGQSLGIGNDYGGGEFTSSAAIDDVTIYGSLLTPAQLSAMFAGGPGPGALPAATPVLVASGATFDLGGVNQQVASLANVSGSGGTVTNSVPSTATLTLAPPTATSTNFGGVIQDGAGTLALVVSGAGTGTQILSGPNTYSGGTTISGGVLSVQNTSGSGTGTGNVVVQSGGTLSGGGTLGGLIALGSANAVTIASGGTLVGGTTTAPLHISGGNGLVLQTGSISSFAPTTASTTNPLLSVNSLTAPTGSSTALVSITGSPAAGTYDLIGYGTTGSGFASSNFAFQSSEPASWSLVVQNSQLDLVIASGGGGNTSMNAVNYWSASPPGSNLSFGTANNWSVQSGSGYVNIQSTIQSGIGQASGSPNTGGPFLLTDQGTSANPNQGNPLYAAILAGTNSGTFGTSGGAGVTMSWRARAKQETDPPDGGTPTSPPLQYVGSYLISNVLNLNGLGTSSAANQSATYNSAANMPYFGSNTVTEHETDPFVLQMNYNVPLLSGEAAQAKKGTIYLGWLAPAGFGSLTAPTWEKAFTGDFNLTTGAQDGSKGTDAVANFQGSFLSYLNSINDPSHGFSGGFTQGSIASLTNAQLDQILGAYGVDPSSGNHDVWAVINHNSQFAVVPEPSTLLLAALALAGLTGYCRRRRRS